ncbi:MAG: PorP/SprF family type IX secretion system membrane protein [Bacteroidia bacterium]
MNKSTIICIGVLLSSGLKSQDIHFSQFYTTPTLLNPSTAGASQYDYRLALNYRNQWNSIISPFKTAAVAFDSKFYIGKRTAKNKMDNHFGYGIYVFNDQSGISKLSTNQLNGSLAYHLYLKRSSSLSFGVQVGAYHKSINASGLKWDAQYNGKVYDASASNQEPNISQSLIQFDLGVGMQYRYINRYTGSAVRVGGSMMHITKPSVSFNDSKESLNYKYVGHISGEKKLNPHLFLQPSAMFLMQGNHSEITFGSNVKFVLGDEHENVILSTYKKFSSAFQAGVFYRNKDAVILTTGFEFNHRLLLGISYDINVSQLRKASNLRGGIEFSLILTNLRASKLHTKY